MEPRIKKEFDVLWKTSLQDSMHTKTGEYSRWSTSKSELMTRIELIAWRITFITNPLQKSHIIWWRKRVTAILGSNRTRRAGISKYWVNHAAASGPSSTPCPLHKNDVGGSAFITCRREIRKLMNSRVKLMIFSSLKTLEIYKYPAIFMSGGAFEKRIGRRWCGQTYLSFIDALQSWHSYVHNMASLPLACLPCARAFPQWHIQCLHARCIDLCTNE